MKKWKIFHGTECPNCGDAVEVYSNSPVEKDTDDITWVFDDEECRCADHCGWEGQTVVDEEMASINEGNLDELTHD